MKALGYVRVSTEDQAREGVSLDAQRARITAYCQYRDFELSGIIEDAGISGGKNRAREGFIRLLDAVEADAVDVLVLFSLDRLSRDMLTLLALERLLNEHTIELHTIEGQITTATPDGFLAFAMKALLGEMERRQVKYRTRKALQHMKAAGQVCGKVAYGFRREGDRLEPAPEEQATIDRANGLYRKGRRLVEIVRTLNREGRRTRTGQPWKAEQTRRLLTGYRGTFKKTNTAFNTAARRFIEAIA